MANDKGDNIVSCRRRTPYYTTLERSPMPQTVIFDCCHSAHSTRPAAHVLLAACGAEESAREEYGRGLFTQAFLKTLEKAGEEQLSYEDLMMRMPDLPG